MYPASTTSAIADSPDEMRHVVRAQMKYGVDVIKILATGGVLSQGRQSGRPATHLRRDEGRGRRGAHAPAARSPRTRTARRASRMRSAPASTPSSTRSLIDDEGIRLTKEHGTYLVADIYNDDYILGKAVEFGLPKENVDKERWSAACSGRTLPSAVAGGREDRVRHRCRRLSAWRQREAVPLHGEVSA